MPRPLRIGLVSTEFPPYTNWGGIAVYNAETSRRYQALGHDVTVIARVAPGAPAVHTHDGVRVHRVGQAIGRKRWVGRTLDRLLHATAVSRKVLALGGASAFDVLETTEAGLEAHGLERDAALSRRLVIQCNGSNARGERPGGVLGPLHAADWAWSDRIERRLVQRARTVIVTSEATRSFLLGRGVDGLRLHLIHQGIDTSRFTPGERRMTGALHIGFSGRLERRKGLSFIWHVLEGLAGRADLRVTLKGAIHPAARHEVETQLARFGTWVRHEPPGQYTEMPAFYRSLDVLLQPSHFENFGLAYVEAMACGVVVFAGQEGGGSEIITNGHDGFLVDPHGDAAKTVNRILAYAERRDLMWPVADCAVDTVARRFSLDRCVEAKLALYRTVAEGGGE
jgi:glycogen(starch) synthase